MNFEKVKKYVLNRLKADLPDDLYYHKLEHSLDVLQAAERIAEGENVTGEEKILIQTAAILHDIGFVDQYEKNEPLACNIANNILPGYEYSSEQVKKICNMIMATAIPQSPKNHLEEILCDADLDYLGRDDFNKIAESLRKELAEHGHKFSDMEWLKFEIDFIEKHKYFTNTSKKTRSPIKQKHIKEMKNALAKL